MKDPTKVTNDPRIGKRARHRRTGKIGTIDEVWRFPDSTEILHLNLGNGLGYGGIDPKDLILLDGMGKAQ